VNHGPLNHEEEANVSVYRLHEEVIVTPPYRGVQHALNQYQDLGVGR
jgi:hypothetical protein